MCFATAKRERERNTLAFSLFSQRKVEKYFFFILLYLYYALLLELGRLATALKECIFEIGKKMIYCIVLCFNFLVDGDCTEGCQ